MENEGSFDHKDSEGFLGVLGVHARTIARAGQV
jgi:argininosuccinate synthase